MADNQDQPNDNGAAHKKAAQNVQRYMAMGGGILLAVGAGMLAYSIFSVLFGADVSAESMQEFAVALNSPVLAIVFIHFGEVFLLIGSIGALLVGTNLLARAIRASAPTIAPEDRKLLEPLISEANEEAVSQYVRVSSLSGTAGFFTKLGFTGLPLVTAALGVFLLLLALVTTNPEMKSEVMDLAKLVLGAFIGSFVQRKVSNDDRSNRPEDTI